MPRTAKKVGKPEPKPSDQKGKKVCSWCHEKKNLTDFYYSSSPMYSLDQRVPFCKECCKNYPLYEDGSIDYTKFKDLLMKLDKPLYYDVLQSATKNVRKANTYLTEDEVQRLGRDILGKYFRQIVMKQHLGKSYSDSEKEGFIGNPTTKTKKEREELVRKYDKCFTTGKDDEFETLIGVKVDGFEVTPEVIELFGEGYSINEYKKMYEKYIDLKQNYQIQTSLHKEALLTYVRFKVKEEAATVDGKVDEAKKWYDAAQNAADKAKLSPKQLTKADLQKGLNSFSEIAQTMEQAVDIVEILPRYKSHPNDSIDFTIWCYINYARKLKGQPTIEYADVYKFYDDMKEAYLSQYGDPYGIFEDDTTVGNRENIQKFITLPSDYADTSGIDSEDEE